MSEPGMRSGRVFLIFKLLAIVVIFFLASFLSRGPSSETMPRTGPAPAISGNEGIALEPGTVLLFGSGILALGFIWKANS